MSAISDWPRSLAQVERIQSERKRRAVELARRAPFFRERLGGVDIDRLDDPETWAKIPLLTKDALRQIPPERFHDEFCVAPRAEVVEYWRSGGVTGRPLFYPRSAIDMEYSIRCFRRAFVVIGATADDLVHVSFPLGIHPVAHLYARAAEDLGIATIWSGSGSNTPSLNQLELTASSSPPSGPAWRATGFISPIWRTAGGRPRRLLGPQDHRGRRAAVAGEAPEARALLGRGSLRPVRHDRGRARVGAVAATRRAPCLVGPVPVRSGRRGDGRAGAGGNRGQPGHHAAVQQQRDAVPALELGRPRQHHAVGRRRPALVDLPGHASCATDGRLLQGPRRQYQSLRVGRSDVLQSRHHGLQGGSEQRGVGPRRPAALRRAQAGVDVDALRQGIHADVQKSFEVAAEITFLDRGTVGREFEASIKAARFVDRRG